MLSGMRSDLARRHRGLTLIELLAVLAIAAMLFQAGAPVFAGLLESLRITLQVNELNQTLQLGRQLAWSAGTDMALCRSRTGIRCDSSATWADGWILFRNEDGDHPPELDPGERIERRAEPRSGVRISANRPAFIMRPFGLRATNGTFHLCPPIGSATGQSITVSYTGKTRLATTACASGNQN